MKVRLARYADPNPTHRLAVAIRLGSRVLTVAVWKRRAR